MREGRALIGWGWSTTDWARGAQSGGGTPCRVAVTERTPYGANSAAIPLATLHNVGLVCEMWGARLEEPPRA